MATRRELRETRGGQPIQLQLLHGEIPSDLQSALRRLKSAMDDIPSDEWNRRRQRCEDLESFLNKRPAVLPRHRGETH